MATVVNARDALLQAAPDRLTGWKLAGNYTVDQSMVTGLGLVVENTRQVWLAASSQVFQIPKAGSTSPSQIVLTANIRNITGTVSLTTVQSGAIIAGKTVALDGNSTFTFSETDMVNDIVTFRLTAINASDSKVYYDELTVVKVREGSDAIVGYLTNENHTVPADSLGNVTNYAGLTGSFKVFKGATDITSSCTFTTIDTGTGLKNGAATELFSATTKGLYTVTTGYPTGSDIVTVTLRATVGALNLDKVLTIAKAKVGSSAKTLVLTATSQTMTYNAAGAASPASQTITFTAVGQNLSGSNTMSCTLYDAAGASLGSATLGGTAGATTRTLTNTLFSTAAYAVVTCTWDGLTDTMSVVRLKDGASGKDAIVGFLTNEATIVATANDGTGATFGSAGGTFKVFDGITDKTGTTGPVTYSVVSSSGVTISIATTGVYSITAMSADNGTATLRAVYGGVTIDKVYSIAKSKAGAKGDPGSAGIRGSRTYYIALSGSTATYSDSLATSTATVDGGPILNDVVTQYNDSVGFSQTKFLSAIGAGPTYTWSVVNAVVDGNLLVKGSVGAQHLAANSIQTYHMKVTGRGRALNDDPACSDITAWGVTKSASTSNTPLVVASVADGKVGQTVLRATGGIQFWSRNVQVEAGRKYRLGYYARRPDSTGGGACFGRVYFFNAAGTLLDAVGANYIVNIDGGGNLEAWGIAASWTKFEGYIVAPVGAVTASIFMHANWNTPGGVTEFQELKLEEYIDGLLLVEGTVQARHIDSRGLSIKDANGNVILAAGSALPIGYAAPGTVNADLVPSISSAATTANWTGINNRPKQFRVVAGGFSDNQKPHAVGLYNAETDALINGSGNTWNVAYIRRSDGVQTFYDSFNLLGGTFTGAISGQHINDVLNSGTSAYIIVVWTNDEPQTNRLNGGVPEAIYRHGASRAIYGSSRFQYRSAYCLVAIAGCGEGNGFESYSGSGFSDTNAWCDIVFQLQNGNLVVSGTNSTPRTLADYSYVGDLNATNGAPTGTYVGGTLAQTVEANASNGNSAYNSVTNASTGLATKLQNSGTQTLGAVLVPSTTVAAGIRVGSLTWDAAGARTGGSGVAITPQGIVGHNGTKFTFNIGSDGNATFGGTLTAQAVNAVSTVNIAGESATFQRALFLPGSTVTLTFNIPYAAKVTVLGSVSVPLPGYNQYLKVDGTAVRVEGVTGGTIPALFWSGDVAAGDHSFQCYGTGPSDFNASLVVIVSMR
jgi:hypothetical protein